VEVWGGGDEDGMRGQKQALERTLSSVGLVGPPSLVLSRLVPSSGFDVASWVKTLLKLVYIGLSRVVIASHVEEKEGCWASDGAPEVLCPL